MIATNFQSICYNWLVSKGYHCQLRKNSGFLWQASLNILRTSIPLESKSQVCMIDYSLNIAVNGRMHYCQNSHARILSYISTDHLQSFLDNYEDPHIFYLEHL